MLKNILIMVIDDKAICAHRRRLDDGATPDDYGCTECMHAPKRWIYLGDVIQFGLYEHDTRTIVECPNCHAQSFFQYMVPAYEIVPEIQVGNNDD